jgi:hypothetical protein
MAVAPVSTKGRKFEWYNGTAFVQILGLDNVDVDEGERTLLPSDDLETALGVAQPQVVGLRGPATITISGKYDQDDTDQAAFKADYIAGTERQAKITRTDATPSTKTWAKAVVRSFQEPGEKNTIQKFSAVIQVWSTETLA